MQESQVILGWIKRGREEGRLEEARTNLLELIRVRLQNPVPDNVYLAVEGTNDVDTLRGWSRTVATAQTLAELLAEMQQQP